MRRRQFCKDLGLLSLLPLLSNCRAKGDPPEPWLDLFDLSKKSLGNVWGSLSAASGTLYCEVALELTLLREVVLGQKGPLSRPRLSINRIGSLRRLSPKGERFASTQEPSRLFELLPLLTSASLPRALPARPTNPLPALPEGDELFSPPPSLPIPPGRTLPFREILRYRLLLTSPGTFTASREQNRQILPDLLPIPLPEGDSLKTLLSPLRPTLPSPPPGKGWILFSPGQGAQGWLSLLLPFLEGDGDSPWLAREGSSVLPTPLSLQELGGQDDEGVESSAKELLEEGRLVSLLHTRLSAQRSQGVPGNGRRESFLFPPLAAPRELKAHGTLGLPLQELLKQASSGVLVHEAAPVPLSGDNKGFLLRVSRSSAIQEGRETGALPPFLIAGEWDSLFKGCRWGQETPLSPVPLFITKQGQRLAVSFSAPALLVDSLRVLPGEMAS